MDSTSTMESIFISGIDSQITESDIKEFIQTTGVTYDPIIRLHTISIQGNVRVLGEATLTTDDAVRILAAFSNSRIKNCIIKTIPRAALRSVIITNLPEIMSEKDLFLILNKVTTNIKRIVIADDPEVPGKSMGVAVATYLTHNDAYGAISELSKMNVNDRNIRATLKDPNFDIIHELSFETRVLHVSPLSFQTTHAQIKEIFEAFGKVLRIKKYATKCLIELDSSDAAKLAYQNLHEKRVDGLVWKIAPSRKYDAEKERDLPDRNICFSKNFLDEGDQQVLLKFAFHGSKPEISEEVLNNANNVIEQAKMLQQGHLDNMKSQLEGFKAFGAMGMMPGGGPAGAKKSNNPGDMMNNMMMQMMMNPNMMSGMMSQMGQTGMNTPGSMMGGSQTPMMQQANAGQAPVPAMPAMGAQTQQVQTPVPAPVQNQNANPMGQAPTNMTTNLNTGNQTPMSNNTNAMNSMGGMGGMMGGMNPMMMMQMMQNMQQMGGMGGGMMPGAQK